MNVKVVKPGLYQAGVCLMMLSHYKGACWSVRH